MDGLCWGSMEERVTRAASTPALPPWMHLRAVLLGEKRLSKEKVFLIV